MKNKIGDFIIDFDDVGFSLSYVRNGKDKFDIILYGLLFFSTLFFLFLTISILANKNFTSINTLVVLIVLTGTFSFGKSFLEMLFSSKSKIISTNNRNETITIKSSLLNKRTLKLSQLNKIEYSLKSDDLNLDGHIKKRFWIELILVTNSQNRIEIVKINPDNFIEKHTSITKQALLSRAKPLINELSKFLKIESRQIK